MNDTIVLMLSPLSQNPFQFLHIGAIICVALLAVIPLALLQLSLTSSSLFLTVLKVDLGISIASAMSTVRYLHSYLLSHLIFPQG